MTRTTKLASSQLDGSSFCSAILVGEADERFVVCVPLAVWSKRVISRLLPAKALEKPIACTVEACGEESREVSENGKTLKVWVGLLSPELEAALDFVRVEPPDYAFGVGNLSEHLLPSAPALAEVLSERFAYTKVL